MAFLEEPETVNLYVEKYADSVQFAKFSILAAVLCSLAVVACLVLVFRVQPPIVIRVNEAGQPLAMRYSSARYTPRPEDVKFHASTFARYYFDRKRDLISNPEYGWEQSLWYMDQNLANREQDKSRKIVTGGCKDGIGTDCTVATFLADTMAPDVEVKREDENTVVESLNSDGFTAQVNFEATVIPHDGTSGQRRLCSVEVTGKFIPPEKVPEYLLPVNPLGLMITEIKLSKGNAQ